jgi:ketosteroid isomerase-like protein
MSRPRSSWTGIACVVAALQIGCGGGAHRVAAPAAVDEQTSLTEAKGLVEEAYGSLRRGKSEGLLPLLAESLWAIGPGPTALVDRGGVVAALNAALPPRKTHKVVSRDLIVAVAPGGRSAWVADEVTIDGTALVGSAVLERVDDFWIVASAHVGAPVTERALARRLPLAKPAARVAVTPPATAPVVARFTEGVTGERGFRGQLADDAIAIGTAPGKIVRGGDAIAKQWKKAAHAGDTVAIDGAIRAALSTDGQLAWIDAVLRRGRADGTEVPVRASYVYRRAGARWELIVAQESVAMP